MMTPEKFNDCLNRIRLGDKSYITEIYTEYYKKMVFTAYSKTRNLMAAQDIASDFILFLLEDTDEIKEYVDSPKSWIYRSISNRSLNDIKHEKRTSPLSEVAEEFLSINVNYELNILITDSIDKLNDNEKGLFILRYLYGLKLSKIANILNLPLGTIKRIIYDIKQKLIVLKKYL